MKFKSQKVAYYFFALSMLLFSLQIVYGFIMAFAHMGLDGLHEWIPFNAATATHKNLLVVWILSGFMGAGYFIIPDESDTELWSVPLALLQFYSFAIVGVIAVVGFHVGWFEGRKFLEIPRPLDYLVALNVILFLVILLMTMFKGKKRTTTAWVLTSGLVFAALLYLPGMIWFDNHTVDSFFRWWVVHLWVEGVWELIMGGILAYLLIKLTGVDREVIEKWLYVIVGLTFLSGILGTGHHYYFIGVPKYWLIVGGIFSALEPLAFLGMTLFAIQMYRKGNKKHPNKLAIYWTLSTAIVAFLGAGLLGLAHTLPGVNLYTHGTLVTAMHGHLAFWGAYASLVLAIISYSMPLMTGRKIYDNSIGHMAFWFSNIGMIGMTMAFAAAGVAQVYMERIVGLDFMQAQLEIEPHFFVLIIAATVFSIGITLFIINFIKFGVPVDEAIGEGEEFSALQTS
ncbi:MAG TPA: nitric-oxide reductase large subunit [Caldithrix abyssi]|uniref:Nitric-oxide reductase large subunit n=1 Tax=Caldithrix abyssi TaxID=187145 RepID=A0A7V1PTT1_CALAY|nr:nitric-oxide reductase large subunit [Caldithrix abyssi]